MTPRGRSPGSLADRTQLELRAHAELERGRPLSVQQPRNRSAIRTHREVAAVMGVSRQRVFQLEALALDKLAAGLAPQGLDALDAELRQLLGGAP